MKFCWELADIKPGRQVKSVWPNLYTIDSVDSVEQVDVGFCLVDLVNARCTPTYSAEQLVLMFNSQEVEPLSL